MNSLDSTYEAYTCNSNQHITFKIVKSVEDIECDKNNFCSQFSHQFFGEGEKIFGYKNPNIELFFSADSLTPYFNMTYEEKIASLNETHADDIKKILLEKLENVIFDADAFKSIVANDKSSHFGKLIHQYVRETESGVPDVFEVCHITGEELQTDSFRTFNARLQYILLFFVDGSSFIDITDSNWEYLVVYQKCKNSVDNLRFMPIGFMTVYNFFAYPDNVRQRISQVLILPPYQRNGHGGELLNSFYNLVKTNPKIRDVTVEDPSEQFQTLRDYIDCRNALELPEFDRDLVKKGLFKKFSQLMKDKLKMTSKQIVHVYEILGLKLLNRLNVIEGMKFKQAVVMRLTTLFGKAKDFAHVEAQAYLTLGHEQKAIMIEREYERLEEYYIKIANKLK